MAMQPFFSITLKLKNYETNQNHSCDAWHVSYPVWL
jgi:hypothetical protein